MKKIIAITILAASFAASSAYSQGYFKLATSKSIVYDGFTTAGAAALSSHVDVALLWAPANTLTPFAISSTPIAGNSTTVESYTAAQAWTALLNSAFIEAQSTTIGGAAQATSSGTGVLTLNGGANFDITSTAPSTSYTLMLVSWNGSLYSSLATAAGAGSAIGWSAPIQYTSGTSLIDSSVVTLPIAQFGTFIPVVAPEPGTLALAALGGAAMLFIRRKK